MNLSSSVRIRAATAAIGVVMSSPLLVAQPASELTPDAHSARSRLSLPALVEEGLAGHPTRARARSLVRASSEVPSRLGSLPDPMFMVGLSNLRIDDPTLDASPMTGVVFGLEQRFPMPGKLSRRETMARADIKVAESSERLLQVLIPLRIKERYWELHYAERALAITSQSERVVNTLTDTIHVRFSVGQGAQQDALQAQTAHSRVRAMLEEQRQAVISARRSLNEAVGRRPGSELPATNPPPDPRPVHRAVLHRRLFDKNPQLGLAASQIEAARTAVEEARYDRYPDFAVGVSYRLRAATPGDMSQGADMVSATLGITLPIWSGDKQSARVREQSLRLDAVRSARRDLKLQVESALERALDELQRLDRELELYREELLPAADQALHASIEDYNTNQVGFVSVLQNWRTTLELELTLERLRMRYAQLVAQVEALVGGWPTEATP